MNSPLVYIKRNLSDLPVLIDVSSSLSLGEQIVTGSTALTALSPVTSTPLSLSSFVETTTTIAFSLIGGEEPISYGIRLKFSTNFGVDREILLAVVIRDELNVPFVTKNPHAFQSLIEEISAGDAAIGKGFFVLPQGSSAVNCYVMWELLDTSGNVFSSGNAYDITMLVDTFSTVVEANAVVHVPTSVPPTLDGQKYQIRWSLVDSVTQETTYTFESIRVVGKSNNPVGASDSVELHGDNCLLSLVTPNLYDTVGFEIFSPVGNQRVANLSPVQNPQRISSGWYYQGAFDTSTVEPSLAPYIVSWKYHDAQTPWSSSRETARIFVINSSIMNAVEDARRTVNKARSAFFQAPEMIFDVQTIIGFLRRGMDTFNGSGGYYTAFDMTDATGGVRDFWLGYSEVALLEAQALAEGEKSFDFQGQAIQLTVERSQYYSSAAETLKSRLEGNVRAFKANLQQKGISGGTGNVNNLSNSNMAFVGITVHPASQFGRYYGQNRLG